MPPFKDLTGLRFGRLTVLERATNNKRNGICYLCICDCGRKKIVDVCHLRNGLTTSCGCFHKERARKANTTHSGSKTRLYQTWCNMKARCYRQGSTDYRRYGGRGITICDEWRDNFAAFQEWALSHGYDDNLTIDRIDVDKGYCPENCQWLSRSENSKKAIEDQRSKKVPKAVVCIETGKVFLSRSEAGKTITVSCRKIDDCCQNKRHTCGGYHWRYATDEEVALIEGRSELYAKSNDEGR